MFKTLKPSLPFILLILAFPQLSETIFAPLLPFIVEEYRTTQTLSQMSLSVYFIGFALGFLFWGRLSDLIGRKKTLLSGLVCYTLGSFLLNLAPSIYSFLGFRVLQAFGAASGTIIAQTLLRDSFLDPKERVATFSTVSAAMAWTPALGPLIGGQLIASFSMSVVFFFLVGLGGFIFLSSLKYLQETRDETQTKRVSFLSVGKRMLLDPQIHLNTLLSTGIHTVMFSIYSETPFVFMNIFQWSPGSYSFIGIGMAIFSVFGARLNKVLGHYSFNTVNRIRVGLGIMLLASFSYMAPELFSLTNYSVFTSFWLLFSVCLVFLGLVIALSNVLGEALQSYRSCLGTAGALFGLSYYILIGFLLGATSYFPSENLLFIGEIVGVLSLVMLFLTKFLSYNETH